MTAQENNSKKFTHLSLQPRLAVSAAGQEASAGACFAGFPGLLLAGYAAVKGTSAVLSGPGIGCHSPGHVPGRDLERQTPRVAPKVLVAASLGSSGRIWTTGQEAG